MKKILLAALCVLSLIPATAFADGTARKETALKLMEVTDVPSTLDQAANYMEDMIKRHYAGLAADIPPEGREALETLRVEQMRWLRENFSWDQLKDAYAGVYTQVFTESEMVEVIHFYQSPSGRKFTKKMPELTQASMKMMIALFEKKKPAFEERIAGTLAELKARYGKSRESTGGKGVYATREAKWSALAGTWFGSMDTDGGVKYMWITTRRNDGTYEVRFRVIDPSGKTEDKTEVGEWGVSGDIYFSVYKADRKGEDIVPVDPTNAGNRDAYKILKLSLETFEYEHLDNGHKFVARKVPADFTFPGK